jgi:hypothetical protein
VNTLRASFQIPTKQLEEYIVLALLKKLSEIVMEYPVDLLAERRAAFLAQIEEKDEAVS